MAGCRSDLIWASATSAKAIVRSCSSSTLTTDHVPNSGRRRALPAAMTKIIAVKLMEENERAVNGFPPGVRRRSVLLELRFGRERAATGTPEDASDRQVRTMVQARFAVRVPGRSKASARPQERPAGGRGA